MIELSRRAALALLVLVSAPAAAENGRAVDLRSERLIERLGSSAADGAQPTAAAVKRSGRFVVRARVNRITEVTGTLFCRATAKHVTAKLDTYLVSQRVPVAINGRAGSCTISMPYSWRKADPGQPVTVSLSIFSSADTGVAVDNSWDDKSLDLPRDGTVTTVDFGSLPI